MVKSRTKPTNKILAIVLAVTVMLAIIPASVLMASADAAVAGDDCQEELCGGKLQWVDNEDKHYLICDNSTCLYHAIEEAYLTHDAGEGESDCQMCHPPHVHGDFVYAVENEGTLVASCGAGECDLQVAVTLVAPADLTYNGQQKQVTITGADEWEATLGEAAPQITYSALPQTVGSYTASITAGDVTASISFEIVKAIPSFDLPIGLTAVYGQTLKDVVLPAGFAWVDDSQAVGNAGSQTFAAIFTPLDTDNYEIVDVEIAVTVDQAPISISVPTKAEATQTTITLNEIIPSAGDGKVWYGIALTKEGEITWQESPLFEGLEGSTEYYFCARVEATDNYAGAISMRASIPTEDKLNGEISPITITDWVYGDAAGTPMYEIVRGEYSSILVEYAVKDSDVWTDEVPTQAGSYTVRVLCEATPVWAEAVQYADFEIAKREITIQWDNTILTYNAQEQAPTATIIDGVANSDEISVSVSGAQITVNGGQNYVAEASLVGDDAIIANYFITTNLVQVQFSIVPKEITIEWSNTAKIHTQNHQKPDAIPVGVCDGDTVTVDVSGAQKLPNIAEMPSYTATATLIGEDAANYVIADNYNTVEFTISNLEAPAQPYTIVKAKDNTPAEPNANGWYNYDIKIIPAEGFKIGLANNTDEDFHKDIEITKSQDASVVYLRNEAGEYTGEIYVDVIKIDKVDPTVKVKYSEQNVWETFLEVITFGLYRNEEIQIDITAGDDNSQVESISYYVSNVGMSLESVKGVAEKEWKTVLDKEVRVSFKENADYVVYVKVVDKAGRVTYASSDGFVYDDVKPVINVSFDNNTAKNESYFDADRTATITITEHNFDPEGVKLTVTENGENTSDNYTLNWVSNGDEHTAEITFTNEADYTFEISCTDKAGNENDGVNYGTSVAPTAFTIDKTVPSASLTISGLVQVENGSVTWPVEGQNNVLETITYQLWSQTGATVSATSGDNLSGIDYIEYFKSDRAIGDVTMIDWDSCENYTAGEFRFDVAPNAKFVMYVHVVDKAGKEIYLSSDGVIVDNKKPGGDNYALDMGIELPAPNANGFYNEDDTVKVDFTVVDPKYWGDTAVETGTFSGIKEIKYEILAEDLGASEGNTFDLAEGSVIDPETGLIHSWTGSIVVNKDVFNSNNVVIRIIAIDNAGNEHVSEKVIKIDVTAPTIDVSYDNNVADNDKYFKDNRVATIVVTERNFRPEDVKFTISNTDGVIPAISEWVKTEGSANGDNTKWTATIVYDADGDYAFNVAYTDLADNDCAGAQYGDSVAPTEFTVDKTLPVVSVSYDNNSALNGKYFAAARIATVVVYEHNFDVNRVTFTQTAQLDGANITIPAASWVNDGDVHTATIVYDQNGDYTFDVKVTDMAANESEAAGYGDSVAAKDFVVDQTIAKPVIGGVANGSAYKNDVIPTISFSDINYASYEVKLTRTRLGAKDVDVTEQFIQNVTEQAQGGSGTFDTFEKIVENDGIYTLTVKMIDKAGNEASEQYTFTVNRFGSVYQYSDELVALIHGGGQYVTDVKDDLVITEYNADRLLEDSLKILITRDGETVDVAYTSNPVDINADVAIGADGWYQYVYTIKASNFEKDGVYKISLNSKYGAVDSPENDSTSVPDNSVDEKGEKIVDAMSFTVDSVAPEIRNIVNLEKRIVNAQTLEVKYTLVDVGGLKSVEIILNGETVDTVTEFGDSVYNYSGKFTIKESPDAQTVQIKVTDLAGNVTDTASEDFSTKDLYVFNDRVTVSTNFFVRWYANKLLFWGSIGGVVVLAAVVCFLVAAKKKKKEEAK